MTMGVDMDAISVISWGTRRWVIASMDKPSAESWRISALVRTFMGVSLAGVGGIVVLQVRSVGILPTGSAVGRRKCFRIGHVTKVDVCPWAALWFPWAMQRKQDGGQSQPLPLCRLLRGQLK